MVTPPKPPTPAPCSRFDWHCDACGGDNVFDMNPTNRPSSEMLRCLGCGNPFPIYLDAGILQRFFRAFDTTEWEKK
jgi:hypothetical protein